MGEEELVGLEWGNGFASLLNLVDINSENRVVIRRRAVVFSTSLVFTYIV